MSTLSVASQTANSGEESLEIFGLRLQAIAASGVENPFPAFKLIILDYNMPGMNGPETASEMHRSFQRFQAANPLTTPLKMPHLCCLTASSGKKFRDKALGAGIDDFCLKPLSIEHLKILLIKTRVFSVNIN